LQQWQMVFSNLGVSGSLFQKVSPLPGHGDRAAV